MENLPKEKIYNTKAPLHYNQYWWLDEHERELCDMAKDVLFNYIQTWEREDKLARYRTFAQILTKIGFKVFTRMAENTVIIKTTKDLKTYYEFEKELNNITRGNFEHEVVQIAILLDKYKEINYKKLPWFKRLFKKYGRR